MNVLFSDELLQLINFWRKIIDHVKFDLHTEKRVLFLASVLHFFSSPSLQEEETLSVLFRIDRRL